MRKSLLNKPITMKALYSTKYSNVSFNLGVFILRVILGAVLMNHGYQKLIAFSKIKHSFLNFLQMGSTTSLVLIIFAELFCGFLIMIGMFTRLAAIPITIGMAVVFFVASGSNLFAEGERGGMYLAAALLVLLCGPGKVSIDGMMGK